MSLNAHNTKNHLKDLPNVLQVAPMLILLYTVQHFSPTLLWNAWVVTMPNPPGPRKDT